MSRAYLQHRLMVTGEHSEMELKNEWSTRRNPTSASRRASTSWTRMIEMLLAVFGSEAPVGYEDESGFHFGVRPR